MPMPDADDSSPSGAPLPHCRCPLCGQANACAPVTAGRFDVPCWCSEVRFAPEVLARIAPSERHRACLCRRCAEGV